MLRIQLQNAYVLHSRPYRNTSLLLDIFTEDYGRISAVAKSARGPKSRYRGILQVFTPMLIDWVGDGDLKTLGNVELQGVGLRFQTKRLFCAYYINELLVRLLLCDDAVPRIYALYQAVLSALSSKQDIEIALREFELGLLNALGYGISFMDDCDSGEPLSPHNHYALTIDRGFSVTQYATHEQPQVYMGDTLLAINAGAWVVAGAKPAAKSILRALLAPHLGKKPLQSRKLLIDIC